MNFQGIISNTVGCIWDGSPSPKTAATIALTGRNRLNKCGQAG